MKKEIELVEDKVVTTEVEITNVLIEKPLPAPLILKEINKFRGRKNWKKLSYINFMKVYMNKARDNLEISPVYSNNPQHKKFLVSRLGKNYAQNENAKNYLVFYIATPKRASIRTTAIELMQKFFYHINKREQISIFDKISKIDKEVLKIYLQNLSEKTRKKRLRKKEQETIEFLVKKLAQIIRREYY
ncbi:MAG: hypothetical protein ABH864_05145 [archaeon]